MKKSNKKKVVRKMKNKAKKNVRSQKRDVKQFKFSLLPEEEKLIVNEAKKFSSFSNFVRHHLGLRQLSVGRKKVNTQAAFVLEDEFLEQYLLEENIEIKKTENVEKTETVKVLEEPILLQVDAKQNPKNDFQPNDSNILELKTEKNNPQTISNSTINIQTNSSNLNQLNSEKIENNDEQTKPTKSKTESPIPEEIIQRSLFEM